MKFKLLLWLLGFSLQRASKINPKFQDKLEGKDLTLEVSSEDGVAYHYIFKNKTVMSYPGRASKPTFLSQVHKPDMTIRFKSAKAGFKTLTAKDKQFAMMHGLENKQISIEGNVLYLGWFQTLGQLMK